MNSSKVKSHRSSFTLKNVYGLKYGNRISHRLLMILMINEPRVA